MSSNGGEIKIINGPALAVRAAPAHLPREGEEEPEAEERFGWGFFTKKPVQELTTQIDELRDKIAEIVASVSKVVAQNAILEEVTIGLAVSIDGSIGIASAGAEVGIELTYKMHHEQPAAE